MISRQYPYFAFCSAVTPTTPEHYEDLKRRNINTISVCLHSSGFNYKNSAEVHTYFAREAGMYVHAYLVTDLYDVEEDAIKFTLNFTKLGFSPRVRITIVVNSDEYADNREQRIIKLMNLIARYHDRKSIDLAFFKKTLDDGLYDLSKLPQRINLTIINTDERTSGVPKAGTWVYKIDSLNNVQFLAYDYRGYYTGQGYQLSLLDTDYVVQAGDTWYSISQRHNIPLIDLLVLNDAQSDEAVYEGQVVRIA